MGGAYAGVAEGANSYSSNLSCLAHRAPSLAREWDWDFIATWARIPLGNPSRLDLDNDGRPDQAASESTDYILGLSVQGSRFGGGFYVRGRTHWFCPAPPCTDEELLRVDADHYALGAAAAFARDSFIFALAIYGATASFRYPAGTDDEVLYVYTGSSIGNGLLPLEFDFLHRPNGQPYRFGFSYKPEIRANAQGE